MTILRDATVLVPRDAPCGPTRAPPRPHAHPREVDDVSTDPPGGLAPPSSLLVLQERIDTALERALEPALEELVGLSPRLAPIAEELREVTASGKRIRPALLLLGFQAADGVALEPVEGPALALELLHTCALLHDDVIDRAATRRGRPTTHRAFAEQHRSAGWSGDAGGFGEAMAILIGDLAFVYADRFFLDATVPAAPLLQAFRRFTTLREEVMAGQTLDVHAATSGDADRDAVLTIATLKSGRYSVARPLEIGALLAGAPPDLVAGLGAFGDPLGRAFQIRDDLLGVFGDARTTGKSTASDLAEGKRTLLIAEAMARLDEHGRAALLQDLGDPDLDDVRADRLRELIEACGARAATERYVEVAVADARRVLTDLDVPARVREQLGAVATYLGERHT